MRRFSAQFTLCPYLLREGDVQNAGVHGGLLVEKIDINQIMKYINFIIPLLYITIGCVFLTNLFSNIDRSWRIIFGIIIIVYGIFRVYQAYEKMRRNT
jgi:hypothetical protein